MNTSAKREASVSRQTAETDIRAMLGFDGRGRVEVKTPLGFMDHMLTSWAKHALFDLTLTASGDVEVDAHHTVEDIGLVLGEAVATALGDRKGIRRFGWALVPMDEALAECALDLSGRPYLAYDVKIPDRSRWEFDCNLVKEFFQALASAGRLTLHLQLRAGDNYHHCCEAVFKAAGRALCQAVELDPRVEGVPSSKGRL
jgi:imidazoleglycerol-phosphate dehydratase